VTAAELGSVAPRDAPAIPVVIDANDGDRFESAAVR
jgi:hypothetical protein